MELLCAAKSKECFIQYSKENKRQQRRETEREDVTVGTENGLGENKNSRRYKAEYLAPLKEY
jgi:hypothetical protein